MDLDLANLLLTIGFVMLGSIVFHISTLISGYSIYREMQPVESAFLSTAVGLIIFLLSPIAFIVLRPSQGLDILDCILDFNVILSFLLCAIGLGMVFGNLKILDARVILLTWIREKSGIPFWISFHGVLWDDVLTTVKRDGTIFIEKDKSKSPFDSTGSIYRFISASSFDEKREMLIEMVESGDKCLIPLDEMGFIRIPEKSLRKHEEKINHIGQALCCLLISIGIFFLALSAKETYHFVQSLCTNTASILTFYWNLGFWLMPCSIIMLVICVWTAKKDFDNWRSYYEFCPDFGFLSMWLSFLFLQLIFPLDYKIENVILLSFPVILLVISIYLIGYENKEPLYNSKYRYRTDIPMYLFSIGICSLYLAFIGIGFITEGAENSFSYNSYVILGFFLILITYISLIRKWITNPVKKELQKIIADINGSEDDQYRTMGEIVRKMYSEICFDNLKKSNFTHLNESLECRYSDDERNVATQLIKALTKLEERDDLKYEAGTILSVLQRLIKDKRKELKDVYRTKQGEQNDSST